MAIDLSKGLLTAQGVNPQVVATWNPDLRREKRLLVPIQVDALPVRVEGGTWADCRMASPDSVDVEEPRSIDLLPLPFTDRDGPRARGVYLHWAMPDGLLHLDATEDSEQEPTPPPLPDRWLVVRLWSTQGGLRRSRAAWVVDARTGGPPVPLADWRERRGLPGVAEEPVAAREVVEAPGVGGLRPPRPDERPGRVLVALLRVGLVRGADQSLRIRRAELRG